MKNVAFINDLPNWYNELSLYEREKLEKDSFYYSMIKNGFSYKELLNSGWINHGYSHENMTKKYDLFMSQLEHVYKENNEEELFLILNTGSYAPAHFGHIAMMKQAQFIIKERGLSKNPIMMLSPSHDKYVLTKSEDIKDWNIDKRVNKLNEIIKSYPYKNQEDIILIDLWESIICDYPVNFTDVIKKIAYDLDKLYIKYKIAYVYGSDNEDFGNVFKYLPEDLKSKYYGVCIVREGYTLKSNNKSSNVFYIENIEEFSHFKSRSIRKNSTLEKEEKNGYYAIREDNEIALKKWIESYPKKKESLIKSYKKFNNELNKLINKYTQVDTQSISLSKQRKFVKQILNNNHNIINLDIGTNDIDGQYKLNWGRLFGLNSLQNTPIKMIYRPEETESHIFIPKGVYTFMDDDIASGKTFELVKQKLEKEDIYFNNKINLAEKYFESEGVSYHLYDIVDTKDFLIGAFSGGLLCYMNGVNIRVPYIYPFVNLKTRAKISYNDIREVNKEILKMNKDFFNENYFLTLKDIEDSFIRLLKNSIVINENDTIETIIDKFLNKLN